MRNEEGYFSHIGSIIWTTETSKLTTDALVDVIKDNQALEPEESYEGDMHCYYWDSGKDSFSDLLIGEYDESITSFTVTVRPSDSWNKEEISIKWD